MADIGRWLGEANSSVDLNGSSFTLQEIVSVARHGAVVRISIDDHLRRGMEEAYRQMMLQVQAGIPIYGCSTGYGARANEISGPRTASERVALARQLSESIAHTDVSVGPELPPEVVRAAIAIRINMLLNDSSAVRSTDLDLLAQLLNLRLTPVVHAYGGLGASGDLAHNARVVSVLRRLPGARVRTAQGEVLEADQALSEADIGELRLEPKAGLGLVNGDNFSTAAAALLTADLIEAQLMADVLGAMVFEALLASDRSFHPMLFTLRPHAGAVELAALYRSLLEGSKLARQEMLGHGRRPVGEVIQDGYSLRALAQSEALNREILKQAIATITINANSVSDNPLWVSPAHANEGEDPWQWVSGGNFLAQHVGETMDSLRKVTTRLVKRCDRHLARLVTPQHSGGLPANLSDPRAVSSCAFKGIQIQSGMLEVYSMVLAQPVTTLFGVHEESNQDLTVHSLTSALLGRENLGVLRYSLAMVAMAVAQAVDLRGGPHLLSPRTRPVYDFVRARSGHVTIERPLAGDIEALAQAMTDGQLARVLYDAVLPAESSS